MSTSNPGPSVKRLCCADNCNAPTSGGTNWCAEHGGAKPSSEQEVKPPEGRWTNGAPAAPAWTCPLCNLDVPEGFGQISHHAYTCEGLR